MGIKVIFLDIDGVLNTEEYLRKLKDPNQGYADPDKISLVHSIISGTGAKIVVSSNRRFDMKSVLQSLPTLRSDIIGSTGLTGNRISEIEDWVAKHDVQSFVVIDDMLLLFPDNLVQTDPEVGLTASDAGEAIRILNNDIDTVLRMASVFKAMAYSNMLW